jgi:hypothetical protein
MAVSSAPKSRIPDTSIAFQTVCKFGLPSPASTTTTLGHNSQQQSFSGTITDRVDSDSSATTLQSFPSPESFKNNTLHRPSQDKSSNLSRHHENSSLSDAALLRLEAGLSFEDDTEYYLHQASTHFDSQTTLNAFVPSSKERLIMNQRRRTYVSAVGSRASSNGITLDLPIPVHHPEGSFLGNNTCMSRLHVRNQVLADCQMRL